jgi:ferritin-like metal-binding protein YciE
MGSVPMWGLTSCRYRTGVSITPRKRAIPGGMIMASSSKNFESLDDLFWHEIGDLYSAEEQLTEALPKMVEKASDPTLKDALSEHLLITRNQLDRLQQIFDDFGREHDGTKCQAMAGLIAEGDHMLKAKGSADVRDAGIIAAAQRVEHYEISGYGTARALATRLGHADVASLLGETLEEEKEADSLLNHIAETQVNAKAMRA